MFLSLDRAMTQGNHLWIW